MTKEQAIKEIQLLTQVIDRLQNWIITKPILADHYRVMIADAEKEIVELCRLVFKNNQSTSGGYGCPFTTTEHTMNNCAIKELVFKLIEDNTKEELEAMLKKYEPSETLYQVLIPTSDEQTKKKEEMLVLVRCIRMAIAYLNDTEQNEI